jgi:hypothetical protein
LLVIFSACTDESEINKANRFQGGLFVINEGNFDWGEGTITYWNSESGEFLDDVFKVINNRSLGNVAQSMTMINDKGYIVVNNSGKIEVVNIDDFKSVSTITGMKSPRYILPINSRKMYVSDLYADGIYVIIDGNVGKFIPVSGWTNRMISDRDGKVWVARRRTDFDKRPGGTSIVLIDSDNDVVMDSVEVGMGVEEVEIDDNGNIWTACSAYKDSGKPAILQFNQNKTTVYPVQNPPTRLRTDGNKAYYLMGNGLYSIAINDTFIENKLVIKRQWNLYGLGVKGDNIYLADAKDYVQKGTVYKLDKIGNLLDSVKVGVIPGDFCFID